MPLTVFSINKRDGKEDGGIVTVFKNLGTETEATPLGHEVSPNHMTSYHDNRLAVDNKPVLFAEFPLNRERKNKKG